MDSVVSPRNDTERFAGGKSRLRSDAHGALRAFAHVSASSPPSCAESAALICGRPTHVSARLRHHWRRALCVASGTRKCPPCLRHHVRRARRASASATRKCPPQHRNHVLRALRASAGGKCMYGERAAFRAAHASVHIVSATICGESCALLRAAHTHTCPLGLSHHVRRAMRASAGCTRMGPLRLRHHVGERCARLRAAHACLRLVSATVCGERGAHL